MKKVEVKVRKGKISLFSSKIRLRTKMMSQKGLHRQRMTKVTYWALKTKEKILKLGKQRKSKY